MEASPSHWHLIWPCFVSASSCCPWCGPITFIAILQRALCILAMLLHASIANSSICFHLLRFIVCSFLCIIGHNCLVICATNRQTVFGGSPISNELPRILLTVGILYSVLYAIQQSNNVSGRLQKKTSGIFWQCSLWPPVLQACSNSASWCLASHSLKEILCGTYLPPVMANVPGATGWYWRNNKKAGKLPWSAVR